MTAGLMSDYAALLDDLLEVKRLLADRGYNAEGFRKRKGSDVVFKAENPARRRSATTVFFFVVNRHVLAMSLEPKIFKGIRAVCLWGRTYAFTCG